MARNISTTYDLSVKDPDIELVIVTAETTGDTFLGFVFTTK